MATASPLRRPRKSPLFALALLLAVPAARAYDVTDTLRVYGHAQFWFTVVEQMEEAEELYQFPSRDAAATYTTGFSINRARIGARQLVLDNRVSLNVQLRLEKSTSLLDLNIGLHLAPWLSLYIGQLKVPAPAEALTPASELDFIFRPRITESLVDFSLSRTTYPSSLFYSVHCYLRDMGLALKGTVDITFGRLGYFLMAGNGLGANQFISGRAKPEYILTNPGQLFYGLRLEAADLFYLLTIGGHAAVNWHDNMVFNSGRKVVDIKRIAASGDATLHLPGTGIRLRGLYGRGDIRDDYDDDGRIDLRYSGWECRLLWHLNPLLFRGMPDSFRQRHRFELGVRLAHYQQEWNESNQPVTQKDWVLAVTYQLDKLLKLQLNYMNKHTTDPAQPDLDDNLLLLQVQGSL